MLKWINKNGSERKVQKNATANILTDSRYKKSGKKLKGDSQAEKMISDFFNLF